VPITKRIVSPSPTESTEQEKAGEASIYMPPAKKSAKKMAMRREGGIQLN
jgi:hypothetical protein